jgi:hypothetical protein
MYRSTRRRPAAVREDAAAHLALLIFAVAAISTLALALFAVRGL